MNEQDKRRRRRIAILTVVLPVLAGIVIFGLGRILGNETASVETQAGKQQQERQGLVEAAMPAETGSPAPRVRLTEGASGRRFDSSELGGAPFAVVFTSTRCEAIGAYLGRVARALGGEGDGDVLVISADPRHDTPHAVRAWLARNHVPAGGPLHFLVGDESELRGLWNAWGFNGPSSECPEVVTAHLVDGASVDTGIVDLEADSPAQALAGPLTALVR